MGLNWLSLPENDVRDPVHRQRAAQRPAGPQRAVPRFRAGSHAHGAVPLRAGLGVRIERPGCDPFPQRDLGWSSYAVSRRRLSAPRDGGWKLLATALAPTWSGPAGFSRQYDEIIGVPILQHSPKKGSRDSQFGRLFVAWVERPAKFRVGKG